MNTANHLSYVLNNFFNKTAEEISNTTGFIQRKRKLKASSFIKAMVLGNLGDTNCSIDGFCQLLREDSIEITKQGLDFRFTDTAVLFMKEMFQESLNLFKNKLPLDCQILKNFKSVKLLDSSYLNLPSSMKAIYKGYGSHYKNRKNNTKSGVKFQLTFDYLNQVLHKLDLKEGKSSDQGYKDHLESISKNDLLIADLGYFVPASFKRIDKAKAYFISRYKSDTNLYKTEMKDKKIDLLKELAHKNFLTKEVYLGKEAKIKVRIICKKLTPEQSIARRRKANKLAKSHGYKSSKRNQRLLDWSIFITNIPENKIKPEQIGIIYRIRWQIELLFKLYKSQLKVENIKGKHKSSRILCELYAKLCVILIFHGLVNCVKLEKNTELSLTKAIIEFKKRARELFLALNNAIYDLKIFLAKLILAWSKFSLKDKYRKKGYQL